MYERLQIIETDFNGKYLIKHEEKTMYVGFIVRDIVELLINGKNDTEIHSFISNKYSLTIDQKMITEMIEDKIDTFINKKQSRSFIKIIKLFDPAKMPIHRILLKAFETHYFYCTIFIFALSNVWISVVSTHNKLVSVDENVIFYPILLSILVLHELGHSICAKKYNVNVNEVGFGIYYILPVFYVDLNEAWKLDRTKRILINLSGIYVQLILGVLLYLLACLFKSQQNVFISLFFSNFAIILLNLNPFLKFDGYWIVSDLLNENNLNKTSNDIIKNFLIFKSSKPKKILLIYSFLKMIFISWVLFVLFNSFYSTIILLRTKENIAWYNYLPIIIIGFFFYRLLSPILKAKQNATKKRHL